MASRFGRIKTSFRRNPSIPPAFSRAAAQGTELGTKLHGFNKSVPSRGARIRGSIGRGSGSVLRSGRSAGRSLTRNPVALGILAGTAHIAASSAYHHHINRTLRREGIGPKNILKARRVVRQKRVGMGRIKTGAALVTLGGFGGPKAGLPIIATGALLSASGHRSSAKAIRREAYKLSGKSAKIGNQKTKGMSRSQAARIAAMARWHGGRR